MNNNTKKKQKQNTQLEADTFFDVISLHQIFHTVQNMNQEWKEKKKSNTFKQSNQTKIQNYTLTTLNQHNIIHHKKK